MMRDYDYIVVFITAATSKEGEMLAKKLIARKLAACLTMTPVTSIFTWKGKTEKAKEALLIVKSRRKLFKKLQALVQKYHSYDVPEIIALPIIAGSEDYLGWIKENTM
jgi:periplasmic divalent cation tolerance protein